MQRRKLEQIGRKEEDARVKLRKTANQGDTMNESHILILVTAPSHEVGEQIAMRLVEERLAACANLVGPIQSTYRWEGAIEKDEEILLMIKTRSALFDRVAECVRQNHPYSVPEVIGVTISHGLTSYLDWINKETAASKE